MSERLRAYFCYSTDEPMGFAVIAKNSREAKKLAYKNNSEDLDCEYTDIRVRWVREANVEGLSEGVIDNSLEALRRHIYDLVEDERCEVCGNIGCVYEVKEKIVCMTCYDDIALDVV